MPDRYEQLPKWARDEITAMRKHGPCWNCGRPPYSLPPEPSGDPWGPVEDVLDDSLDPIPPRLLKVLQDATREGWAMGPTGTTMVTRLHRPGDKQALPFWIRWDLAISKDGKHSWRFHAARAANGQRLSWNDIKIYLADPSVLYTESPDEYDEMALEKFSESGSNGSAR